MTRFQRIKAGEYKSDDGRILINRVVSRQTYRADEILWSITVDGRTQVMHYNTLKEAREAIIRG